MIESATAEHPISLADSWMVGDKRIDVETGHNAGMKSALVMTGYGKAHLNALEREAEVIAEDLLEAVRAILR